MDKTLEEDCILLSQPKPRPRKVAPPIGGILLIVLLLVSAWVNYDHHRQVLARERWLATPVASKVRSWPEPVKTPLPSLPFSIGESSGVLWDLNNRKLLWALDPHAPGALASTTKLMTIYLILSRLPLNRTVVISPYAAGIAGSDIKMAPGNRFTVRQLLYGLMLRSANDAAVALAQAQAGHVATFVQEMNRTASGWGLDRTHFADPDGLSRYSRGTAWDLSVVAEQDWANPLFRKIVATKLTALPHNPVVRNLNGLLFLDPTVRGVKTGWTTQAGFNLVFAATRKVHGRSVTLLGVILHGQKGFAPEYADAERILQWGFDQVKMTANSSPSGG